MEASGRCLEGWRAPIGYTVAPIRTGLKNLFCGGLPWDANVRVSHKGMWLNLKDSPIYWGTELELGTSATQDIKPDHDDG